MSNNKTVIILYTNWKGETRKREILLVSIEYKTTEYHKEEQWILNAKDIEKDEMRSFAIKDIKRWG